MRIRRLMWIIALVAVIMSIAATGRYHSGNAVPYPWMWYAQWRHFQIILMDNGNGWSLVFNFIW